MSDSNSDLSDGFECSICWDCADSTSNWTPKSYEVRSLLKHKKLISPSTVCDHQFHRGCIFSWIKTNNSTDVEPHCPLCRADIKPNVIRRALLWQKEYDIVDLIKKRQEMIVCFGREWYIKQILWFLFFSVLSVVKKILRFVQSNLFLFPVGPFLCYMYDTPYVYLGVWACIIKYQTIKLIDEARYLCCCGCCCRKKETDHNTFYVGYLMIMLFMLLFGLPILATLISSRSMTHSFCSGTRGFINSVRPELEKNREPLNPIPGDIFNPHGHFQSREYGSWFNPLRILLNIPGIDLNRFDYFDSETGETFLSCVSEKWSADVLKDLLSKEHIAEQLVIPNQLGFTPLHLAAKSGSVPKVKMLMDAMVREKIPFKLHETFCLISGKSPLHIAAEYDKADVVKFLVASGHFHVNERCVKSIVENRDGNMYTKKTALQHAVHHGSLSTVKTLLAMPGIKITETLDSGRNLDFDELVTLMKFYGVGQETRVKETLTPLHMACTFSGSAQDPDRSFTDVIAGKFSEFFTVNDRVEIFKLLVEAGANANWHHGSKTPLQYCPHMEREFPNHFKELALFLPPPTPAFTDQQAKMCLQCPSGTADHTYEDDEDVVLLPLSERIGSSCRIYLYQKEWKAEQEEINKMELDNSKLLQRAETTLQKFIIRNFPITLPRDAGSTAIREFFFPSQEERNRIEEILKYPRQDEICLRTEWWTQKIFRSKFYKKDKLSDFVKGVENMVSPGSNFIFWLIENTNFWVWPWVPPFLLLNCFWLIEYVYKELLNEFSKLSWNEILFLGCMLHFFIIEKFGNVLAIYVSCLGIKYQHHTIYPGRVRVLSMIVLTLTLTIFH